MRDDRLLLQCQQFESGLILNYLMPCYGRLIKKQLGDGFDEKDPKDALKLSENCQLLQQLCFMARFPHLVFDITNKLTSIPEGPALEVFEAGFSDLVQHSLRVICNQLFNDALQAVDESLPPDLVSPIVAGIH